MIKKFSSPKIKIWFEPMFFSGFFCGFECRLMDEVGTSEFVGPLTLPQVLIKRKENTASP